MLAHAKGEILFITGAGTSRPAGLPDFRQLVLQAYQRLDPSVHEVMKVDAKSRTTSAGLTDNQNAEVQRFDRGDFDVVLGMLERRIDGTATTRGKVRQELLQLVRTVSVNGKSEIPRPAPIHRSLIRLADRGAAVSIATTNFDRLLQAASAKPVETHSLGAIPRPSLRDDFSGVLHIHGVLNADARQPSDVVVTDRDFGEFYLRRRIVPDFIYDAARLYNLVLVGYSANDAPMRYLLNAVAADGSRFRDLRERYAFVNLKEIDGSIDLEDWRGRGITPIPYDSADFHKELATTLSRWSDLSAVNGTPKKVETLMRRLVKKSRAMTAEPERDLFDHLFRRSNFAERLKIASNVSSARADVDWLDAMNSISAESDHEGLG
ncbi:MAG: SIR2 family protein [Burkholderiaceae bacterium]|nr:SIR2 family protein [Burkholderiaceae bacterium]